jgi:hydroxymethylpyrimidine/phosphomethylpyrimidine kinase
MTTSPAEHPVKPVLLVSATDSSGAAGMAVDIRTADRCGVPLRLVATAVTAQGMGGVQDVFPQPVSSIAAAFALACESPGPGAVKVGMLADAATAEAVAGGLAPLVRAGVPVVVDPVLRATSGGALLDADGIDVLIERIIPLSTLLTPNAAELSYLARAAGSRAALAAQKARALMARGAGAVLVKGGEGKGPEARDMLYLWDREMPFVHSRDAGPVPRGTGCALSAAIACSLARGSGLAAAVEEGIALVQDLIAGSRMAGGQRLLFP